MVRKIIASTAVAAGLVFSAPGIMSAQEPAPTMNIVETAVSAGSFNTLVTAVKAAGLVETLSGPGPFTVFAPTDEAFAQIPEADLNALLADKEALTAVLTYHVVPGDVMAADVAKLSTAKTVNGQSVDIKVMDGKVMIDGAEVISADIKTTNGVIHVINKVILPEM
ncbi:MAG: fasciclin domain-containing protein [Gemmatimonadota bacterium]